MTGDVELRSARSWDEVRRAAIGAGRTFPGRLPEGPFFFERTVRAPTLPLENTLLLLVDGEIVSQLQVYERGMHLGDARARIGAIGNVYTLPEHQREGFGRRLLAYARDCLADRGYALSALRTGTPAFYRTAGWEPVPFDRHRIDDPAPVDGASPAALEPFEPGDLDRLVALYRASRGADRGSLHRPRVLWTDWILDPAMEVLPARDRIQLYRPDGDTDAEGYLAWDRTDDGVACLEVGFDGTDRASFLRSCWAFLLARTDGAVEWHPPVPDALDGTAGGFDPETRDGDMVQVHAPEQVSRLTRGAVEDTADLVAYLSDGFYWSNVDSF